MPDSSGNAWLKLVGVSIVCIAAITFVWAQYRSARPDLSDAIPERTEGPRGARFGGPGGPPGPGDREGFRQRMAEELNLTEEQQTQMQALWEQRGGDFSPERRGEMRQAMEQILTPEQREQFEATREQRREMFRSRMLERAGESLPPDQLEVFEERLDQRMEERRRRWGDPLPGSPPPPETQLAQAD